MARRLSRAKKKRFATIIIAVVIVAVGIGTAFFLTVKQIRTSYQLENDALNRRIIQNQRLVYRATKSIPAGSAVTDENTAQMLVPSNMDQGLYMTEDDIGKIAVVDIAADQDILFTMLGSDDIFSVRECEYALLALNNNLKVNDFVDVRILYPNGENYTVISKKCVKGIDLATNEIFMWLNETELMDMSSAIVDVFLHEGAILYTTKYIEDGQEELTVNYQPSKDVMVAIANDPNIIGEAMVKVTERMDATLRETIEVRLDSFKSNSQNSGSSKVDLSGTTSSGGSSYFNGSTEGDTEAESGSTSGDDSEGFEFSEDNNNSDDGGFSYGY